MPGIASSLISPKPLPFLIPPLLQSEFTEPSNVITCNYLYRFVGPCYTVAGILLCCHNTRLRTNTISALCRAKSCAVPREVKQILDLRHTYPSRTASPA